MANPAPKPNPEGLNHSRTGTNKLPGIIKPGLGDKPKVKVVQLPPPPAPKPAA